MAKYGVIFYNNRISWENKDKILNYELSVGKNCVNKVAKDEDVKAYKLAKLKEQEEAKKVEEAGGKGGTRGRGGSAGRRRRRR